jgi:hypothetical protein
MVGQHAHATAEEIEEFLLTVTAAIVEITE